MARTPIHPGEILADELKETGWMNLQKTYELDLARRQVGKALKHIRQRPSTTVLASDRT